MKSQVIIELKKDPQTNLYSLLSVHPKVSNGGKSSPSRRRDLKRSNPSFNQEDHQSRQQTSEILPPKSKRHHAAPSESYKDQSYKEESQDPNQRLGDDENPSQLMDEDGESQKIDENEVDYSKTSFIIPSCSAWFNIDKIHEIEMQALPEFFCDKFPHKNPQTYFDFRNYIIKLYREAPNSYLSATVCRKNLPGDVCSIIRLHAFLEHWGLINFNVDPSLKPVKIQLGASGNINQQIIDIASKGYLKLSEAHSIANQFAHRDQQQSIQQSPSENVYLIAARKINILSSYKRPTCNFCGNLCGFYWYKKKLNENSYHLKEEQVLKNVNEGESLHSILKSLTTTYLVCQECFEQSNYPQVLQESDFERTSLETLLKVDIPKEKSKKEPNEEELEAQDQQMQSDEDEEREIYVPQEWTEDEKERLIEAVALHNNDWEEIADEIFQNKFSAHQCALQFLSLPISEGLMIKFQNQGMQNRRQLGEDIFGVHQNVTASVFQDCSNPLLSQLAIFVKSLDHLEKQQNMDEQGLYRTQSQQHSQSNVKEHSQPHVVEKRQTRKQYQKKVQKDAVAAANQIQTGVQNNDVYLVPQSTNKPCLSKETMDLIREKAEIKSKRLMKQKRKEIEAQLNQVLFAQIQKLEHKMKFLREFWNIYQVEKRDLALVKEEALAERVALSMIKSGEIKGQNQLEKILGQNEFALSKELIKEIKE